MWKVVAIVLAALVMIVMPTTRASAQAAETCTNSAGAAVPKWNAAGVWQCAGSVPATQQTGTTTEAKVTIAVTNTYQQALAASSTRKGCTLQYIAVGGTKGFVFFGAAPADTTTSIQLTNGQSVNCQTPGVTLTDAVQVTATGTDIFVVTNQ